jgi:hypothetical protein
VWARDHTFGRPKPSFRRMPRPNQGENLCDVFLVKERSLGPPRKRGEVVKRRISLLRATAMVVAVMMVGGISLSSAQPSGGPTCTGKWFKDWYVWDSEDGAWLYY